MKARIIYTYKDKRLQEIMKEHDIASAAELKGFLKKALDATTSKGLHTEFDIAVDVDYGDRCPILTGQFVMNVNLIDELKEKNKKLEEEVENFRAAGAQLHAYNKELKRKNEELMNQPSVSEYEAKIEELTKEIKKLDNIIITGERVNKSLREDVKKLQEENKLFNEERKELKKTNNELMDKIELLEDTLDKGLTCCVHSKLEAAEKEIKKLEKKLADYTWKITDLSKERDDLFWKVRILETDNEELVNQPSVAEFEAKIKDLEKDIAVKQVLIGGYVKIIDYRNADIKKLEEEKIELKKKASEREELIESLKGRNDMLTKHWQIECDRHDAILKQYKDGIDDIFYAGKACAYTTARRCVNEVFVKDPIYDAKRKTKYSKEEVQNLLSKTMDEYQTALLAHFNNHKEVIDEQIGWRKIPCDKCWTWDEYYFNYVKKFKEGTL